MIEPVQIRAHSMLNAKYDGKQILFDCGNGYGLSVVTALGRRSEHGLYCNNDGIEPTQYEVMMICNLVKVSDDYGYDFDFVPTHETLGFVEPIGWQSIQEIGELAELIASQGFEAWPNWMAKFQEDYDDDDC